jgi:endoglucanase
MAPPSIPCGARILGAYGQPVQITGVSWFGMETGTYAPHGLWTRNWKAMLDQIAALGFNTVRLPFSNDALVPGRMPQNINYDLNPDLAGKTSLAVMDMLIQGAADRGLKVILGRHRPTAEGQSELWYTDAVPEQRWIADWTMLAQRYRSQPALLGMDLHNEPRGAATWGSGDPATDWRLAAQRAGNAILAVNPYVLIFVQGVERSADDWYWWGGNFTDARSAPVQLDVPGRVVYSPHDYGPDVYDQPWFDAPDFPNNLPAIWDARWGYLAKEGIAPVVLGEFGGKSVGQDADGVWQRALMDYAQQNGVGWLNWSFNPDSGEVKVDKRLRGCWGQQRQRPDSSPTCRRTASTTPTGAGTRTRGHRRHSRGRLDDPRPGQALNNTTNFASTFAPLCKPTNSKRWPPWATSGNSKAFLTANCPLASAATLNSGWPRRSPR